jgi:predicted amidohydrolase YtcJ
MFERSRRTDTGGGSTGPPERRFRRGIAVTAGTVAAIASTAVLASAGGWGGGGTPSAEIRAANAPDIVLYNGKISTVDARNSVVGAIAIRDGEILATGRSPRIKALAKRGTQVVNLRGRRVLPGLIDGHLHGMRNAYHCFTQTVRLDLVTTRAAALDAYAAKAGELPDGSWIWTTAGGWNVNQLDDPRVFTFEELTAAAPSNPVWVSGSGFTGPRVNQAALDALGLAAGSPGVEVGPNGTPTGQLTAPATTLANTAIYAQLNTLGIEGEAKCLEDFIRAANGRGLTAWKDAGGNTAPWGTTGGINQGLHVEEPTMDLYRSRGLNARIAYHAMSNYEGFQQVLSDTQNAVGFLGDDMLRYLGPGEDTMATDADYDDYTRYAAGKRLSVETHVGDLNATLDGFEAGNEVYPISKLKWRIAHPENGEPTDDQLARAANLGIGYALTFASVRNGATGPRFRSTMESGARMCLSSDAMNVAPWAPFQNLWYVTTGDTLLPGVPGVPEDQQLTREEALRHATVECAWFLDQDGRLGSLEAGKHADLIVLSEDYFTVSDDAIKDIRPRLTIVDGRIVFADGEYSHLGR